MLRYSCIIILTLNFGFAIFAQSNQILPDTSSFAVITESELSPDGSQFVFISDRDGVDHREIFSKPSEGGLSVKLNPDFPDNSRAVIGFRISPDGTRVVYGADQDADDVFELFSVPILGGPSIKLNPSLIDSIDLDIDHFGFHIDSSTNRVIYTADQEQNNVRELFSVDILGGPVTKLNPNFPEDNRDVLQFPKLSPEGSRVVYFADQETDGVIEMYSVAVDGGPVIKLNPDSLGNGRMISTQIAFNPDGSRVVYKADQEVDNVNELFSVPILGGTATKLNPTFPNNNRDVIGSPKVSADGNHVVYIADQETDEVRELYSVPITGGTAIKLNSDFPDDNRDVSTSGIQISPDGSKVVYLADQITDNVTELFSVPITGGTAIKLNSDFPDDNRDVSPSGIHISPDGSKVVYLADQIIDGVDELFSVPSGGGTPIKLNEIITNPDGEVSSGGIRISPDGNDVIFLLDDVQDQVFNLFITPIVGGVISQLNPPIVFNGDPFGQPKGVSTPDFILDGSRIVYSVFVKEDFGEENFGDNETVFQDFSVPTIGGQSIMLNPFIGCPDDDLSVLRFVITPGEYRAVSSLLANSIIEGGGLVNFVAGQEITMEAGFEIEIETDFTAEIEEVICNPNN